MLSFQRAKITSSRETSKFSYFFLLFCQISITFAADNWYASVPLAAAAGETFAFQCKAVF